MRNVLINMKILILFNENAILIKRLHKNDGPKKFNSNKAQ